MAASDCFRGKLPPLELYRLAIPDTSLLQTQVEMPSAPRFEGSIAIAPYEAPGVYGNRNLVFRIGDTQYGTYPSREWALPVPVMLGMLSEEILHRTPLSTGGAIYAPPSYRSHDLVWRGVVRELEEVDRGRQVFASVRLEVRLVRATDDSLLWTGSARRERSVPHPTMNEIVSTLSSLSAEVIQSLADQAHAALTRSAASAARR
jgi:ABC-type uncharacterized transport system auxiliary subunit